MGLLDGSVDFALRGAFGDVNALLVALGFAFVPGAVGDEGPLDFVGVEETRFLAVGFVQVILIGIGVDT